MEARLTDELILNTYLFAKKRLADNDAEELAQTILVEALEGLRRAEMLGRKIESFHGWYWRLAENQLKIYLRLKYNGASLLYGDAPFDSIEDYALADSDLTEAIVSEEEKSELNFALSRLSRIHREILISVYLREMTVAETAVSLGIPEGTVKRRLFDAKKQLRGELSCDTSESKSEKRSAIIMENTGRSAYAPAELDLVGSLGAPDYWDKIDDLMTKQIFVTTASKARTVREIADEIGVAPVYFEEKLNYLVKEKFLKETSKGKFIADIVILPKQKKIDFDYELAQIYAEIAPEIRDAVLGCEDKLRELEYYGNDFSRGRLMWLWYVWACDMLSKTMTELFRNSKPGVPKDNGKRYRFMGIVTLPDEKIEYRECKSISWSNLHLHYRTSDYKKITFANLYETEPFADRDHIISDQNIAMLMRFMEKPGVPVTHVEETMTAGLIAAGFLEKKPDGFFPAMPIMSYKTKIIIDDILRTATNKLALKYVDKVGALGDRMLLPLIRSDLYEEYVNWIMLLSFWPLPNVLWQAMNAPDSYFLEIPDDYTRSANCTTLYYEK